jgi:hypothetical protein
MVPTSIVKLCLPLIMCFTGNRTFSNTLLNDLQLLLWLNILALSFITNGINMFRFQKKALLDSKDSWVIFLFSRYL